MTNIQQLREAVKQVGTCVNLNSTIPVLKGVKLEKGFLYASSEEVALKVPLETTAKDGIYDFSKLSAAAFALDDSELSISDADNGLNLKTKKSKVLIPLLGSVSEWPNISNNKIAINLTLNREQVQKIAGLTAFVSKDEIRPGMMGICFDGKEFCATNGNAIAVYPVDLDSKKINKIIIPAKVFTILAGFDTANAFLFKDSTVKILQNDLALGTLIYRQIDEAFPDYQVYTDNFKSVDAAEISFEKSEMMQAINVNSISVDTKIQRIDFDILPEHNVIVSAHDFEKINQSETEIHSENTGHTNKLEIALSLTYLKPTLKFINTENIKMRLTLPNRPVFMYADNVSEFVLVMPMMRAF